MSVVLYTNHCPCCEVLESRLKAAGIQYRTVDDVRLMLEMGLTTMPMLEVSLPILESSNSVLPEGKNRKSSGIFALTDDMMMNYSAALKWLEEGKLDHES